MADDLSSLLGDLDPSIVQGLGDLAGMGDNATALASYQGDGSDANFASTSIVPVGGRRPSMSKAVKLLGAAMTYFGSGALSGILPGLAQQMGVAAGDLLSSFLAKKTRGGRRRGITYRQLANARRVNNTIDSMYHRLHASKGGGHHRSRGGFRHMKKRSR